MKCSEPYCPWGRRWVVEKVSIWKGVTLKSVVFGAIMAAAMCAINSLLTLKAGVIEEGPLLSAIIFAGIFFAARRKVTSLEAVIVATMGSAGGSFGFVANLFAAYRMLGIELSTVQMCAFTLSTGMISVVMAIPFYYLFVVRDTLPWQVGEACAKVIGTTIETRDTYQGKIIAWLGVLFFGIILMQGKGLMGLSTVFFSVGAVGIGMAWSPFLVTIGGVLGLRNALGFLVGMVLLVAISPYTDSPASPHLFFWPGVSFLITSQVTVLAMNWKSLVGALRALRGLGGDDVGVIIPTKLLLAFILTLSIVIIVVLCTLFSVGIMGAIIYVIAGVMILNLIAVRCHGDTTFNPARATGAMMIAVGWVTQGANALANMTGAGMIAGGTNQTSILCQDLYTGKRLGVNPKVQVALQAMVLPIVAIISVLVFKYLIDGNPNAPLTLDSEVWAAPVAKVWAGFAMTIQMIAAGDKAFPEYAPALMIIFGIAGVAVAIMNLLPGKITRFLPGATGIGLGMILNPVASVAFFIGCMVFLVLEKQFKVRENSLASIVAAGILGEGLGSLVSGMLKNFGIFPL